MPGHGNHWECLYPSVEEFAETILPEIIESLPVHGEFMLDEPITTEDGGLFDRVMFFMEETGRLRHMLVCVSDSMGGDLELFTAYPFVAEGTVHEIEIKGIVEWENGLEAQIEGVTAIGSLVTFFDALYFQNKTKYRVGQKFPFALSALAYRAEGLRTETIDIPKTDQNRELWDGKVPEGEPFRLSLGGAAVYLPAGSPEPDDYQFQMPIASVETLEFHGGVMYRVFGPLARGEDEEASAFDLPVFISARALPPDLVPAKGMDLTGILWMQGILAE